jgi:hypothetical protein
MTVPDQVRDDGSGIHPASAGLDSGWCLSRTECGNGMNTLRYSISVEVPLIRDVRFSDTEQKI